MIIGTLYFLSQLDLASFTYHSLFFLVFIVWLPRHDQLQYFLNITMNTLICTIFSKGRADSMIVSVAMAEYKDREPVRRPTDCCVEIEATCNISYSTRGLGSTVDLCFGT
jgi:hypothetical protein